VNFAARQVRYLGFKVGENGLEADQSKTEAIRKALPLNGKTSLRRFLGMTGFYRIFVKCYSTLAAPLNKYLKGDQPETFTWTKPH
jgi:hypothetical protein